MSLCPSWIKCAVSLRNMYTNNSSYAYVSTTKFIDRVYLRFQLRVGSCTIMTLYSYMGNIMAECNRHLYICIRIYIKDGCITSIGENIMGMTAPLSTETPRVAIVWQIPAIFIHRTFIIYRLHLRNNARGFAYATVSGRGNIAWENESGPR